MNSKYDQIISEFVKNTSLKKIRVTVDPKVTGFEHDSTYEGFVLEEDQMGNIVAIVPDLDGDNIMEIPFGGYSPCDDGMDIETNPELDALKKHIVNELLESDDLEEGDPEIENILSFTCIHQLHNHLNQKNIDDDKFLDILKGYFSNE